MAQEGRAPTVGRPPLLLHVIRTPTVELRVVLLGEGDDPADLGHPQIPLNLLRLLWVEALLNFPLMNLMLHLGREIDVRHG